MIGEHQKFPAALIVPNFPHLRKWCESNAVKAGSNDELIRNRQVVDCIAAEVREMNKDFGQAEQVKKFELVPSEWTVDSGELTATLKLRRKIIGEKYRDLIGRIYEERPVTV